MTEQGTYTHPATEDVTTLTEHDDAVRLVEDIIDATSVETGFGGTFTTDRTAPAILAALVERGWRPPTPSTWVWKPDNGVPDVPDMTRTGPGLLCPAREPSANWACTRGSGHTGRHAAGTGTAVRAVWS